jgi:hypothetical protein
MCTGDLSQGKAAGGVQQLSIGTALSVSPAITIQIIFLRTTILAEKHLN